MFHKYNASRSGNMNEDELLRCFYELGFSNGRQNKTEDEMRKWVHQELKKGDKAGDGKLSVNAQRNCYCVTQTLTALIRGRVLFNQAERTRRCVAPRSLRNLSTTTIDLSLATAACSTRPTSLASRSDEVPSGTASLPSRSVTPSNHILISSASYFASPYHLFTTSSTVSFPWPSSLPSGALDRCVWQCVSRQEDWRRGHDHFGRR